METLKINPKTTVALAGHRTIRTSIDQTFQKTLDAILKLNSQGYSTFISSMAKGFDMLAAEAVLQARLAHPEIRLIAVIPFAGDPRFTAQELERYHKIVEQADQNITLFSRYEKGVHLHCKDFMIQNADQFLCYYSGKPSETMYTIYHARRNRCRIINIFETKKIPHNQED